MRSWQQGWLKNKTSENNSRPQCSRTPENTSTPLGRPASGGCRCIILGRAESFPCQTQPKKKTHSCGWKHLETKRFNPQKPSKDSWRSQKKSTLITDSWKAHIFSSQPEINMRQGWFHPGHLGLDCVAVMVALAWFSASGVSNKYWDVFVAFWRLHIRYLAVIYMYWRDQHFDSCVCICLKLEEESPLPWGEEGKGKNWPMDWTVPKFQTLNIFDGKQ